MRLSQALATTALLTFLTACGGGTDSAAPVVTVTATQPAPTSPAEQPTAEDEEEPTPPAEQPVEAERRTLPNVVGMNLQEGQDTMQAAGFYILNDKDATGRNRFQISDRNWVITKQTPAAGRKVSVDTLVTLYAKKIGE